MQIQSQAEEKDEIDEIEINPVTNFLFALKAPETKRQYPKRLEMFLDFFET